MDILIQAIVFIAMTMLIVFLIALFIFLVTFGIFAAIAVPLLLIAGTGYLIYLLRKKLKPPSAFVSPLNKGEI